MGDAAVPGGVALGTSLSGWAVSLAGTAAAFFVAAASSALGLGLALWLARARDAPGPAASRLSGRSPQAATAQTGRLSSGLKSPLAAAGGCASVRDPLASAHDPRDAATVTLAPPDRT